MPSRVLPARTRSHALSIAQGYTFSPSMRQRDLNPSNQAPIFTKGAGGAPRVCEVAVASLS
jgi:hypothetical protein